MAKTEVLSFKVEPEVATELRLKATKAGKKLSELLIEGIVDVKSNYMYKERFSEIERENLELRNQLKRMHKNPNLKKRVSIPLTLAEFDTLEKMAQKSRESKSSILRGLLVSKIPSLN